MSRRNNVLPPSKKQSQKGKLANKNKTQRRRKRPRKNQNLGMAQHRAERFRLSPCSDLYLKALVNPFDIEGGKACVPDLLDLPSFKCLSIFRGSLAVGTAGNGFVFVSSVPVNDVATCWISQSGWSGTSVPTSTATANTALFSNTNNPFPTSAYSTGAEYSWRSVGAGLRVRYLGTELNRSGRLIPFRTQDNYVQTTLATFTTANFLSRPEVPSIACDREWATVTWLPQGSGDFAYLNTTTTIGSNTAGLGISLGFWVDGAAPDNKFEFEFYLHSEIVSADGSHSPPGVTPSHADVPGMSAIRNVLETNLPAGVAPESEYKWIRDLISQYAPEDMSHVISGVVKGYQAVSPLLLTL